MNREEFKKIVAALKSVYPKFGIETKEQFDFWYELLKDIPYKTMQLTVKKYSLEEKWPPTIADLRKSYTQTTKLQILDSNQAWGEVKIAIRNFGSLREVEALESMSPITATVVKNMSFKELCLSENQMADRAHFMKMYDSYSEREQKQSQLPPGVKKELDELMGANALGLEMPDYKTKLEERTHYISYESEG